MHTGVRELDAERDPVFVVGALRSGTTLLAAMLSGHSRIAIGPESHFFRLTDKAGRQKAIAERWPDGAADYLSSLQIAGIPLPRLFGTDREEIVRYLGERAASERALFESMVRTHAQKQGKERWGEKTPNHILHLDEIRRLYPESFVIHIVRDPRDVAPSICQLPTFSDSVLANAYLWRDWVNAGLRFAESNPKVLRVEFEQLLQQPEAQLRRITEFIGEEYEPRMRDTSETAAGLRHDREVWKEQVAQPLDPSKAFRWKRSGDGRTVHAISSVCHREIARLGYSDAAPPTSTMAALWLDRHSTAALERILVELTESGIVLDRTDEPLRRLREGPGADVVICGWPKSSHRLRTTFWRLASLAWLLLRWRLSGRPVGHLLGPQVAVGRTARAARWLVLLLGKPLETNRLSNGTDGAVEEPRVGS